MEQTAQMTITQVAARLDMTPDGVYKLIQRGKLEAVRVSARKTRVTPEALERFIAGQQAAVTRFQDAAPTAEPDELRRSFIEVTGRSPEHWLDAWKRDEIADTSPNMRLLVRAVALREHAGQAPIRQPEQHPWAQAAFSRPW
jgi:excisionase family DNA binding protein